MFQVPSFRNVYYIMEYTIPYMGNTVGFLPYYGIDCRKGKKTGKTWRNEVDTKIVKIATSEIHFSILKRNFTIL